MAITHPSAVRTAIADLVVDRADLGTTAAAGKIRVYQGSTTIVDILLANPAFGAAAAGVASGSSLPKEGTAVADGTVDKFELLDRDNVVVFTGLVTNTAGAGDMKITNTAIKTSEVVRINTMTYTAPL